MLPKKESMLFSLKKEGEGNGKKHVALVTVMNCYGLMLSESHCL